MTDDPLDLNRVAADDAAIEQLRLRAVPPDDSALQLLRDLLSDLDGEAAAEQPAPVPVGRGSTVLRLAGESAPDPRVARGGVLVAALTAGMVVLGGVAAASTAVAPGNPLHGMGEAVRSAAGAVVEAVKPPDAGRRADPAQGTLPAPAADRASEAITSRPAVPVRPAPAAAARADAAVFAVTALLDRAEAQLDQDRTSGVAQHLDAAERRLAEVPADASAALRSRLAQLRDELAQALQAPRTGPAVPGKAEKQPAQPDPKPEQKPEQKADAPARPKAPAPARQGRTAPAPERLAPVDETGAAEGRTLSPRQPSRLASAKPRA